MGTRLSASSASTSATHALGSAINHQVATHGAGAATHVTNALAIQPLPKLGARARLWRLLRAPASQRPPLVASMTDHLRRTLPTVLKKLPIGLANFGFKTVEEMIAYLVAGIAHAATGAKTFTEFSRGLKGWRWNAAGRLLFERFIKFDPALDAFFGGLAKDFFDLVNMQLVKVPVKLVNGRGDTVTVKQPFRRAQKVLEFKLRGADGVVRSYTDFGFLAVNPEGFWGALLIELKMPSALAGVAEQFSEFVPRLKAAQEMIAVIIDKNGVTREQRIDPSKFVLLEHERGHQVAVAPLSIKAGDKLLASGQVGPADVGKVMDVAPTSSERYEVFYYKVRVLVLRDWLVSIVKAMTD